MAIRTTENRLQQSIIETNTDDLAKSFGKYGYDMLAASTATGIVPAGTYYAVHFITDTVVTWFRGTDCTGVMTGTYPQGCTLYLDVTELTLGTGGPVVLYKNKS